MDNNPQILGQYLHIIKRRKLHFGIPAAVVFLAAVVLAYTLPPIYRSTATILIESPQVPENFVTSSVTGYAVERIQSIHQEALAFDNIWQMAEDFNLFPEERTREKAPEIVKRIREGITMEMVSRDVINPNTGRSSEVTFAFDISFDSASPEAAKNVADRLAQLFLEENKRSRFSQAEQTSSFLAAEAQRLNAQVVEMESKLAEFKREHPNLLPQFAGVNRELLERAKQQRNDVTATIQELESRQALLRGQMSSISAGHDDRLNALLAELAAAREKFSDIHPDVLRIKRALEALESGQGSSTPDSMDPQTRTTYVATQSELETVTARLRGNKLRLAELDKDIAEYQRRLERAPNVETQYLALNRDYENAVQKYGEIRSKQMQAQVSEQLEKEQKGERLTLLQSPRIPTDPIKPNRLGYVLLGFMFAMVCGVGVAAVSEFRDHTIHGVRELAAVLKAQPIGIIPVIGEGESRLSKQAT